ncbi:MAG: tRNA (adenosine(37)-N6)-threonylcarbamoyltransferase complex ATPase subunit type 1 TsaE [Oscillospiraceae bacterium]|nr:tRNA (adenosine(37)-N6)-threonylcarbamoyltransferase complex ATPase subunit type 1 TsaE [Oscillospiraceae bacterium]
MVEHYTKNELETERVGEAFAKTLRPGAVVAMRGGMGVGKTAFVRGLARGLGETARVTSPTYTIVNEYDTTPPLFHFDLYRLGSVDELFEIGFDEYLSRGGICMIEWSENAPDLVFTHIVEIKRDESDDNARFITISEEG